MSGDAAIIPDRSYEANVDPVLDRQYFDENPERLHNDRRPDMAVIHEKPEHRVMIMLKAQGYANREIAGITGYKEMHVGRVLRQPWARQRLLDLLNEQGKDAIAEVLRGECKNSIFTLVELRDTAESEQVRASCADKLLDRYLGRPTQHVEVSADTTITHKDVSGIDAEIEKTQREIERLQGVQGSAKVEVAS